jgi:hypothetical protein
MAKSLIISLVVLLYSGCTVGPAHSGSLKEYQVKAAYLYHFTKFVKWPTSAFVNDTSPFRLCVIGKDPFGKLLDVLSRKKVNKRNIIIRRLGSSKISEKCHILYISRSEALRWKLYFTEVMGKKVLTVGDSDGFAHHGGMVNFIRIRDKLRFEINRRQVKAAGLKVSSAMLQVGRVIK